MAERQFVTNPLDSYDQMTYHIKFFMLPEKLVNERPFDSSNGIIIAESGVTGQVSVSELSFTSYISLNNKTRNTTATQFDISLREFSGASLMDQIFAASLSLGIQNYMKSPYFIEVSFRGRSPVNSAPVQPPGLKWTWPITIQGIETDVDEGGSTYTIKAFAFNHLAQKEPAVLVDKGLSIKDVTTVKEATTQLAEHLIQSSKDKSTTTTSRADQFEITFPTVDKNGTQTDSDNELAGLKLRDGTTVSSTKNRSIENDAHSNPEATNAQVENNSSVIDFINTIITNSSKYQTLVKQSVTANDQAQDGKSIKQLHKVDTKVEQLEYDSTRNDYQRKYTFEVYPYEMGTLQSSPNETAIDHSSVRYNKYKDSGILEKHYSYLFTGHNDQVLEFNMKFNQSWYVNMPKQGGLYTQSTAANESQHFDDSSKKFIKLREDIMAAVANMPTTKTGVSDTTTQLRAKINEAELSETDKAQLRQFLKVRSTARMDTVESASSPSGKRSQFVSDYALTSSTRQAYRLLPVSYTENSKDKEVYNAQAGVESNPGGGREYVNSLFNQAFTGVSGDLVNIEMKVKGDPYWLGPSNFDAPVPTAGKAAQVFMLFTTKTPEIPSISTGVINTRPTSLNGVYGVKQIDHTFQDGMFTQTLYGVRDPLIDVNSIEVPE